MADPVGREAVAAIWRIESARIVGALARYAGDFALAEDLAQEALAEALVTWPRDGVPAHPAGWLLTVGRRRAIDAFRRRVALDERYAALARGLGEGGATSGSPLVGPAPEGADLLWDPDRIDDDVLALMFISCHPVLSREARVALTLRVVGGLTSDEIARVFLVPAATVQARITRAKKTLAAARVPFAVPPAGERAARLGSVLSVIYLIFTEGSSASSGGDLIRLDLAQEAQRLARVLARLMPDEPEVHGLLALLELTAARFPARTGPDGEPVLLEQQDRARWDHAAIDRGRAALARAEQVGRGLGAYGLQAAIAECHAVAPSVSATNWESVVILYEALGRLAPSPVVDLNRAVAVAMAQGPAAALPMVDELLAAGALSGSHLLPSVRGELLTRLGRNDEARAELERAVALCGNERERAVLRRKITDIALRISRRSLPMTGTEIPLAGGNMSSGVVRVGDTVRRPAGPWTTAVHALLSHLHAVGFRGAPRPLGIDERGREILTFIPGTVTWPDHFHLLDGDGQLRQVARLIREFHDAVAGFTPPPGAQWQVLIPADGDEIIAHHDLAPWNLGSSQSPVRTAPAMLYPVWGAA